MRNLAIIWAVTGLLSASLSTTFGQAIAPLELVDPGLNRADEPLAEFSAARAGDFLDAAALNWQKERKCMTCHTNYLYLLARPVLHDNSPAEAEVRRFAEQLVHERWQDPGPRWDAEVVMTAAVLASHDAATGDKLHPTTRTALDRMWTVQRDDGGFKWISCNWPPFESDEHFGATMAALAAAWAPEDYVAELEVAAHLEKLRGYFTSHPPAMLHHKLMLVWVSSELPGVLSDTERQAVLDELLTLQRPDGGWAFATLGEWKRGDDLTRDLETSDGYGTALAVFVARRGGVPAGDERIARGVAWLKSHQRASGRWFTRSAYKDSKHFITHAGTSMALMALDACDALNPGGATAAP